MEGDDDDVDKMLALRSLSFKLTGERNRGERCTG